MGKAGATCEGKIVTMSFTILDSDYDKIYLNTMYCWWMPGDSGIRDILKGTFQ